MGERPGKKLAAIWKALFPNRRSILAGWIWLTSKLGAIIAPPSINPWIAWKGKIPVVSLLGRATGSSTKGESFILGISTSLGNFTHSLGSLQ
jgi:hypothetical protein